MSQLQPFLRNRVRKHRDKWHGNSELQIRHTNQETGSALWKDSHFAATANSRHVSSCSRLRPATRTTSWRDVNAKRERCAQKRQLNQRRPPCGYATSTALQLTGSIQLRLESRLTGHGSRSHAPSPNCRRLITANTKTDCRGVGVQKKPKSIKADAKRKSWKCVKYDERVNRRLR